MQTLAYFSLPFVDCDNQPEELKLKLKLNSIKLKKKTENLKVPNGFIIDSENAFQQKPFTSLCI